MSGSAAPAAGPDPNGDLFDQAGQSWNIDPTLLRAVVGQESGGNATAVSPKGAVGLGQIMPATGKAIGVTDPTDPAQSIFGAAKILRQNLDKFGNVPDALRAYNSGYDQSKWGNSETTAYVPSVLNRYTQLASADTGTQSDANPNPAGTPAPDPRAALLAKYGIAGGGSTASSQTAPANDDAAGSALLAKYGIAPAPAAPPPAPAAAAPDSAAPTSANYPNSYRPPGVTPIAPTVAPTAAVASAKAPPTDASGNLLIPENAGMPGSATDPDGPDTILPAVRNALAPAAGTTYGDILPIARDNKTGAYRLAMPSSVRNLLQGGLDLAEGPATGTVTPAATNALMSVAGAGSGAGAVADEAAAADRAAVASASAPSANPLARVEPPAISTTGEPTPLPAPDPTAPGAQAADTDFSGDPDADFAGTGQMPAASADDGFAGVGTTLDDQSQNGASGNALAPSAPGSGSMGAATSTPQEAVMAKREAQASQATGEIQRLSQPAPSGRDTTQYVPGTQQTEADVAGDAETSQAEKALRGINPAPFAPIDANNAAARLDYYDSLAGTPTILNTAKEARSAQAQTDLDAAFANPGQADAQPVLDTINTILAGPDGKRGAVRVALGKIVNNLQGPDGTLDTDPQQLYGVRKDIDDMLSPAGQQDSPLSVRVASNLQTVKGALDSAILPAAPGFDTYLQNFADASKPIDSMETLQALRPNLTNVQGNITLQKMQGALKGIVQGRAAPGVNPAKSIDDDTMDGLWNLRSDLLRENTNRSLGNQAGSPTNQLMNYTAKLGIGAAHTAIATHFPVVGNIAMEQLRTSMGARRLAKQTRNALNPDMSNPLFPPTPSTGP